MTSTGLLVGLTIAVIIGTALTQARRATVILGLSSYATSLPIMLLHLAMYLFATVLVCTGSLDAGISRIRSGKKVHGKVYHLLFHDASLPRISCSLIPAG